MTINVKISGTIGSECDLASYFVNGFENPIDASTATKFTLHDTSEDNSFGVDLDLIVTGFGFTYSAGALTGGTITKIEIKALPPGPNSIISTITGISLNALALQNAALAEDEAALDALLFQADTFTFTGGAGKDIFTGGTRDDAIAGGGGDDTLTGGLGDDTLTGGLGNDALDGGAGNDTASFAALTVAVTASLVDGTATYANAANIANGKVDVDTLNLIENLTGGSGADVLTGNGDDNVLIGNAGNDKLTGGAGNDTLEGGLGNDILDGGADTDTASYASATTSVVVDLNIQDGITAQNTGGGGADTLKGFENVLGGKSADTLTGDGGDNVLNGGLGNDMLVGGLGADTLIGGLGNDKLTGGAGADLYRYRNGDGNDTITVFENDVDKIDLSEMTGIETFQDVEGLISQSGANTVIAFGATSRITLLNLNAADLGAADFKFKNEAPVIDSDGGGATASIDIDENTKAVTAISATDADDGPNPVSYSISGGVDAAFFEIDANTGALSFKATPDAETPQDQGADNGYVVVVKASDGSSFDTQTITVNVKDVNEFAPATANVLAECDEDDASISVVLTGTDPDATGTVASFSLSSLPSNGTLYTDGTLTIETATGVDYAATGGNLTLHFVPDVHWSGTTSFQYAAKDADNTVDPTPATATVDVAPVADVPQVAIGSVPQAAGNAFVVHVESSGIQNASSVTLLTNGDVVVAWADSSGLGGDSEPDSAKARIFDSGGNALTGDILLNETTTGFQSGALTKALPVSGGFVAVWSDESGAGGDNDSYGVKARIFDEDGVPVAGEFLVNGTTAGRQIVNSVDVFADDRFVVIWSDPSGTSLSEVHARIFNADGTPIDDEFVVNTATGNDQYLGSVAVLEDGRFVVAWEDWSATGGDASLSSVKAQLFDTNGGPIGGQFVVNTGTGNMQSAPTVTALVGGSFLVVWSDESGTGGDASGSSIKGQIFDADGIKVGGEFLVNTSTSANQRSASASAREDGGFVVAWTDFGGIGVGDVKGQIFAANGTKIGPEFLLNQATAGQQVSPLPAILDDGRLFVAWTDNNDVNAKARLFHIEGGGGLEDMPIVLPLIQASLVDTDGSETLKLRLSGFPEGAIFSVGELDADTGDWVISDAGEIATLASDALIMTPPADANGTFTITATAVAEDTAILSGGATSNTASTSDEFEIVIAAVNDAPTITSNGGGNSATIGLNENNKIAAFVEATDVDSKTLTFSVSGGADAALFDINSANGVLQFVEEPDAENPQDSDLDNVYEVDVQVSDGFESDTQSIKVSINDVDEFAAIQNAALESATSGMEAGVTGDTSTYLLI